MLKNHQFYYLLAKLVNKGKIDWENDRDFTESERAAIRQGITDLAFFSPYQATPDDAKVNRKAGRV
jgi:hypothetical protein